MAKKTRVVTKVVRLMYDAEPQLNSLVYAAANQTGFAEIKSADGKVVGLELGRKEFLDMVAKDKNLKLKSIKFDGTVFKGANAVTKFLEDEDFEAYDILAKDKDIEAVFDNETEFAEVKEVEYQKGVKMLVGKMAEEPITEDVKKKKTKSDKPKVIETKFSSNENVKKYDSFLAYISGGKTISEVMHDGADGLPPGIDTVFQAYITAVRNSLLEEDIASVKASSQELANLIIKLADVFASATLPQEGVEKMAKKMLDFTGKSKETKSDENVEAPAEAEAEAETKDSQVDEVDNKDGTEAKAEGTEGGEDKPAAGEGEDKPEGDKEPEGEDKPEENPEDSNAEEGEADEAEAKTADTELASLVKSLADSVTKLTETVKTSNEATKSELDKLVESVSKADERVGELEKAKQSRKGMDISEGSEDESPEELAKKEIDQKHYQMTMRNTLGIGMS